MSRYPYTYAYDYLRGIAGYNSEGTKIGRSDAGQIVKEIANVLEIDPEEICKKLADKYLENEDEISQKAAEEFLRVLRTSSEY